VSRLGLRELGRTARALRATGALDPHPARSLPSLVWTCGRFGGSPYTLARWGARRFPDDVALVEPGRAVTFAELVAAADRRAAALERAGVRPGGTVALLGTNGIAWVESLLACGRLGVDALLLNTAFTPEQLTDVLDRRRAEAVLADADLLDRAEAAARQVRGTAPRVLPLDQSAEAGAGRALRRRPRWSRTLVLTSGTTGPATVVRRTVGVREALGTAGGLLDALRPRRGERTLLTVPLLHGHGLATLGLCLAVGSPLHVTRRPEAAAVVGCIAGERIDVVVLVPTILYRLLAEDEASPADLQSVRAVVCGSAPLDPRLAQRCLARLGPVLHNLYGSSETGIVTLATPVDLAAAPGTVGRPLPHVDVTLRRVDGTAASPGEPGSVWVGDHDTGDVGRFDGEGRLFLLGRADDLLICGGEKVFPRTIEQAVTGALGEVAECVAVGIPDPEYGQAVHLYVEPAPGRTLTEREVLAAATPVLPRTLRPRRVTVVDALPRNAGGKVVRRSLPPP
jgi:acyl-CoA synthetase (AMP-forming)/AMP-acid ligase II